MPASGRSSPQAMARVCAQADIIVPNLTEACLLTGTPYDPAPCPQYMEDLLKKLLDLGCCQALLTGVEPQPGLVGVLGLDQAGRRFSYGLPRLPQSYHGTGDLFASACVGGLMNGLSLEQAAQVAAGFVSASIGGHCRQPHGQLVRRGIRGADSHPAGPPGTGPAPDLRLNFLLFLPFQKITVNFLQIFLVFHCKIRCNSIL